MHAPIPCKFNEDQITTEALARVYHFPQKFRHTRANNSEVNVPIRPEVKHVRDFMPVQVTIHVTCKYRRWDQYLKRKCGDINFSKMFINQGQVTPKGMVRSGPK